MTNQKVGPAIEPAIARITVPSTSDEVNDNNNILLLLFTSKDTRRVIPHLSFQGCLGGNPN